MTGWSQVDEGFRFPALEARVTAERRRLHHRCCDVPEGRFGDLADVSIFGQDTALAAVAAGLPLDGRIHLRCVLRQAAAIALGERLRLEGRVLPYGPSPRGRLLNAAFAFRRADGSLPLEIEMQYLLPGPATGERAMRETEAPAAFAPLAALALTPEKVTGYSAEVGNLIHFDVAFARAAGFRAPLAQGQMQVTAALGALAAQGLPDAFTLDSRFLRPLHWDERATIEATADRSRLRFVAPDGRVAGTTEFRQGV
jgi:acyl dehydratase